jgi:hypothetical protein
MNKFSLIKIEIIFFVESTPSVGHPAMTRQYPSSSSSSSMTHNLTVNKIELND